MNNVVGGEALEGNITSEQVKSIVDVKGGTSGERRNLNCGQEDHFARDSPARGRKGDQCGEIGHFKNHSERLFKIHNRNGHLTTQSTTQTEDSKHVK